MRKQILIVAVTGLIFSACSINPPDVIELDSGSATTINNALVTKKINEVEKDPFLRDNKWSYNMNFIKIDNEYMRNDEIVKGFYLAHNADKIVIIGDEKIAREYRSYFLENQVTAKIEIHPVDLIALSKNRINVLFFSKNQLKD